MSLSALFHGLDARWCPRHISRNGSIMKLWNLVPYYFTRHPVRLIICAYLGQHRLWRRLDRVQILTGSCLRRLGWTRHRGRRNCDFWTACRRRRCWSVEDRIETATWCSASGCDGSAIRRAGGRRPASDDCASGKLRCPRPSEDVRRRRWRPDVQATSYRRCAVDD